MCQYKDQSNACRCEMVSKESKVVFVALTQHCIQSNATHVERVESVYTVASRPCQEGRLLCEPSVLGV